MLDPGIGFGKTPEQSMTVLARLDELRRVRSTFAGRGIAQALHQHDCAIGSQISGLAARSPPMLLAARNGARIIRTHDVSETVQALRVAAAIEDRR